MKSACWSVISSVVLFAAWPGLAAGDFLDQLKSATDKLQQLEGQLPQTPPAQRSAPPAAAPPANSPSPQQTAPAAGSAAQGGYQPWTPPGDTNTPSAPAGPLDLSKLPDISGIRLGMTVPEAKAALQKLYPTTKIVVQETTIGPRNDRVGMNIRFDTATNESVAVDFTFPPNKQVVWHVSRLAYQPNVNRAVLLAALRQKYGKESLATGPGSMRSTSDSGIEEMWWVSDEHGHHVSDVKYDPGRAPFGCSSGGWLLGTGGSTLYPTMVREGLGDLAGYCASSFVGVHAQLLIAGNAGSEFINAMYTDIVDFPLIVRSAQATQAWVKVEEAKAYQQELDRSKHVKPSL